MDGRILSIVTTEFRTQNILTGFMCSSQQKLDDTPIFTLWSCIRLLCQIDWTICCTIPSKLKNNFQYPHLGHYYFLLLLTPSFEQQVVSTIGQSEIRILAAIVTEIYPKFWDWPNCNNCNCLILYQQSMCRNGTTSYPQSHNRNLSVCCQWLSLTKLLFWSQTKSGKLDLWWSQVKSSA